MSAELELGVSEFVALFNQTVEFAYPYVTIVGELANFRVSKNRWIYFDLKDDDAVVRFFGTVYTLPGPLEDGMLLKVNGSPRLHPLYGFSINVVSITPSGDGSIKKAASLLEAKLAAEGLFDPARKRSLPYPPSHVGLITSSEAAAYSDFIKVLNKRWGGVAVELIDVQVQGEAAPEQIVRAIAHFNQQAQAPEVLVITRGGGSAEDLQAFSNEQVTRAVAASRIPTLVAIGHERDVSLAELAADQRASTPSNAAELLVPDRLERLRELYTIYKHAEQDMGELLVSTRQRLTSQQETFEQMLEQVFQSANSKLRLQTQLLMVLDPKAPLQRGYALLQKNGANVRSIHAVALGDIVDITVSDGQLTAAVQTITKAK